MNKQYLVYTQNDELNAVNMLCDIVEAHEVAEAIVGEAVSEFWGGIPKLRNKGEFITYSGNKVRCMITLSEDIKEIPFSVLPREEQLSIIEGAIAGTFSSEDSDMTIIHYVDEGHAVVIPYCVSEIMTYISKYEHQMLSYKTSYEDGRDELHIEIDGQLSIYVSAFENTAELLGYMGESDLFNKWVLS